MQPREPSRTARATATLRAAHQELDGGRVLRDPLAAAMLGQDGEEVGRDGGAEDRWRAFRLFVAARARFAEDCLATAVRRHGVRQLVVLGAGLDTFAYRNPHEAAGLRVFEVDHPATQEWKRRRLAAAGIAPPASLTFAPVDFERTDLPAGLAAAGFDPGRPAFFSWLGVVAYLDAGTVRSVLAWIAALPGGAEVVFDYTKPPALMTPEQRAAHEARAALVAAAGEPFVTSLDPGALAADLRALGFTACEDLGPGEVVGRYLDDAAGGASAEHMMRAGRLGAA
ncbi:class I SAM-dependent methyltransferase [Streptomyces marincola]|uniref:S-adenosyl-L-methionine-dependent methyltransferase n=1 Tax=Streptomyces marincola TaxID=2878388 RepID=A0A1W7D2K0_9ACTN|nr:class I SAM-dependent methyltransferase [Streptomyces marincola]ARQ70790.1 SAM-dependent methyltransferase [Streptomyces marincola]